MAEKTGGKNGPEDKGAPAAPPANLDIGAVLGCMSDAFLTLDATGRITYANAAVESTLGCRVADLLGQEIGNCPALAPGSPFAQALCGAVLQRSAVREEAYFPHRGVWLEIRVCPDLTGFLVYFRDISDLRRAQRALRE